MTDAHEEFILKLDDYRKCLELIAEEARGHNDFDAARRAVVQAMKLTSAINSVKSWFADKDTEATDMVADRIIDKSMS